MEGSLGEASRKKNSWKCYKRRGKVEKKAVSNEKAESAQKP